MPEVVAAEVAQEAHLRLMGADLLVAPVQLAAQRLTPRQAFVQALRRTRNMRVESGTVVWQVLRLPHLGLLIYALPGGQNCALPSGQVVRD